MWRIVLYLVAVLAMALLCIFVVEQHGVVSLSLGSHVYETSLAVVILGVVASAAGLYLALRFALFVLRLPVAAFALSRARRQAKGSAAISKGLVAVASGDFHAAARHAQAAERLAGHEPLALLLKAQAAQLSGNRAAAKDAFARMAEISDTRGLGLRGLFVEARRRGDHKDAHRHAAQAAGLDVFLPWAHEATLMAQCQARDWMAALATLERNHRLGALEAGEMRRAKAALLAAHGLDLRSSRPKEALQTALKALKIDPGLTPAAVTAASVLADEGRRRQAARIIEAAWRLLPHPDLAEAYLGLRPHLPAVERAKQIARLAALTPDHEEARVALGRAHLAARQFAEARATLVPLADARPTARVCLLMAEIEEAENGMTGLAREWLARAAHAPRDPAWIADGASFPHWAPVAPESGRIGGFAWEHPHEWVEAVSGPPKELPRIEAPPPAPSRADASAPALAAAPADPMSIDAKPIEKSSAETGSSTAGTEGPAGEHKVSAPPEDATGSPSRVANDVAAPSAAALVVEERKPSSATASSVGEAVRRTNASGASNEAPRGEASATRIEPVAFPLERAPDDPGAGSSQSKGLWTRLTE
jgi:HemY protein